MLFETEKLYPKFTKLCKLTFFDESIIGFPMCDSTQHISQVKTTSNVKR